MANVIDFGDPAPCSTMRCLNLPTISKATVQRSVIALAEHWTPEQYDEVVEMFQTHRLL